MQQNGVVERTGLLARGLPHQVGGPGRRELRWLLLTWHVGESSHLRRPKAKSAGVKSWYCQVLLVRSPAPWATALFGDPPDPVGMIGALLVIVGGTRSVAVGRGGPPRTQPALDVAGNTALG